MTWVREHKVVSRIRLGYGGNLKGEEGAHSVADTAAGAGLLGDELVANHLLRKLLGLFRTVYEMRCQPIGLDLRVRERVWERTSRPSGHHP